MARTIDYEAVDVPEDKEAADYSYAERRAEILDRIKDAGHPRRINQTELADRYGCTQQNISKDMTALADYVDETLGNRRKLSTRATVERSIEGLLDDGEWRQAAKTAIEFDEWIRENAELEELNERLAALEEQRERAKYR